LVQPTGSGVGVSINGSDILPALHRNLIPRPRFLNRRFRERLNLTGVWSKVWDELQRQLKEAGVKAEEGHIQDAAFIESDLGKRYSKEKKAKKEMKYTEKQMNHISR
jgi:hypothetical protein